VGQIVGNLGEKIIIVYYLSVNVRYTSAHTQLYACFPKKSIGVPLDGAPEAKIVSYLIIWKREKMRTKGEVFGIMANRLKGNVCPQPMKRCAVVQDHVRHPLAMSGDAY
jgi:hypothetical protein